MIEELSLSSISTPEATNASEIKIKAKNSSISKVKNTSDLEALQLEMMQKYGEHSYSMMLPSESIIRISTDSQERPSYFKGLSFLYDEDTNSESQFAFRASCDTLRIPNQ